MTEAILEPVRAGKRVCAAFYGHPGVFVLPSHEAVSRARAEGFDASMQPGVSAEDCLVADLGVDPGVNGLQSYEAGDFLRRRPATEPTTALVLWQIGVVGARTHTANVAAPALPRARGAPARALPGRPQGSGVRSLVLSGRRTDDPRPAARRARRGHGQPRVNAVRAASSSLSAHARRAATTFPFASKSCCAWTAASRPSSVSPAAACASASESSASAAKTGESVVPASSTAVVPISCASRPRPSWASAFARATRHEICAWTSSGDDASSLVTVAVSASSERP